MRPTSGPPCSPPRPAHSRPDPPGYVSGSSFTVYAPPVAAANVCGGKNYIIFIGNGFPNSDTGPSENMKTFLEGVGGSSTQIWMPVLTTTTSTAYTDFGQSSACYNNNSGGLSSCTTANASTCGSSYDTCSCGAPTSRPVARRRQGRIRSSGVHDDHRGDADGHDRTAGSRTRRGMPTSGPLPLPHGRQRPRVNRTSRRSPSTLSMPSRTPIKPRCCTAWQSPVARAPAATTPRRTRMISCSLSATSSPRSRPRTAPSPRLACR